MPPGSLALFWITCCYILTLVDGHGRMVEPPSRSSMWRFGYKTPINYMDNQLYCGGFDNLWGVHNGKCGICGDPWEGPRDNEAGGQYATGQVVRYYDVNSAIRVEIDITAAHKGWFEFRICPNNNPLKAATQECLDRHLLSLVDGTGSRYNVTWDQPRVHEIYLHLPPSLKCSQCVLQWKYHTGNSWGSDPDGRSCIGCGPQEQFYGCADVAIGNSTTHSQQYYDMIQKPTPQHHQPVTQTPTQPLPVNYSINYRSTTISYLSILLSNIRKAGIEHGTTVLPTSLKRDNLFPIPLLHTSPFPRTILNTRSTMSSPRILTSTLAGHTSLPPMIPGYATGEYIQNYFQQHFLAMDSQMIANSGQRVRAFHVTCLLTSLLLTWVSISAGQLL